MIENNVDIFFSKTGNGKPLLGIDLGEKKIGLSISDINQTIASSYATKSKKKFKIFAAELKEIVIKEQICGIVIGWPLNMDGSEGPKCQSTRDFAKNLSNVTSVPITFWDERLTTVEANRSLLEGDLSRAKRNKRVDSVAAIIILQNLLDRLKTFKSLRFQL